MSSWAVRNRLDGLQAGIGWALPLVLAECALALPRWGGLDTPVLRVLFFLAPLAMYGAVGALLGLLHPRLAALAAAGGILRAALLPFPGAFGLLRLATGAALGLLLRRLLHGHGRRRLLSATAAVAGWGLLGLWLLIPRDVSRGVPPPPPAGGVAGRPDLVLVTWDTVRADVLPLYGGRGLETPNLDALAERSVVFEDMTAVAPVTGPTHATILTGLAPPSHGLRAHGTWTLAPGVPTVAELLAAAGWDTGALVAAWTLKAEFGLDRGFRVYDDRLPMDRAEALVGLGMEEFLWLRPAALLRRLAAPSNPGGVQVERARTFLAGSRSPLFLWVHLFDAHGPHRPAPAWRRKALAMAAEAWPPPADPENCGRKMTLYRGEIMELDARLGELLDLLETRDPGLSRTAILLVADHGHCFGEGGFDNVHTPSLQEATQHVPAILHLPGDAGAGHRVPLTVNQVDLAPTLLELAGLPPPPGCQGVSLLALARGGADPERRFFREGFYMEAMDDTLAGPAAAAELARPPKGRPILAGAMARKTTVLESDQRKQALRQQHWKYLRILDGSEHLYDLRRGDELDVKAEEPERLAAMRRALAELLAAMPRAEGRRELSAADRAALAALGYGGDGGT